MKACETIASFTYHHNSYDIKQISATGVNVVEPVQRETAKAASSWYSTRSALECSFRSSSLTLH